jgi:hypothetical protein
MSGGVIRDMTIYYSEGTTPIRGSNLAFGLIGLPLAIFVYSTAQYSHRITAYCTFVRHTHTKLYTEFSKLLCLRRARKLPETAPRSHLLVFFHRVPVKVRRTYALYNNVKLIHFGVFANLFVCCF